ncbi:MAG: site-2 protease family protein [Rhodopirellula sp. JB044]|uniref:site-2 protease family protein n=1 Tax=Rhodopirellula sp. JB044 TaxID=3342844 RepID=UPI00370CC7F2
MRDDSLNDPTTQNTGLSGEGSGAFFPKAGWSLDSSSQSEQPDATPDAAAELLRGMTESTADITPTSGATSGSTSVPPQASSDLPVVIKLDPDVEFTPIEIAGVSMARCVHTGTGTHFQFGAAEYHVAMLLDGTRSVSQVVREVANDGLDWTPEDIAEFIGVLVSQKIAITLSPATKNSPDAVESIFERDSQLENTSSAALERTPSSSQSGRGGDNKASASTLLSGLLTWCGYLISVRLPLLHAEPWASRLTPIVRPLLGGYVRVVAVSYIVLSLVYAAGNRARLSDELLKVFDSNQWLVMIVAWVVLKVVHELGHACTACYHGVRVGRAGVMFFMFAPLAYVDVTDAWKLRSRHARVAIALGGVYFELICGSIAFWLWWSLPGGVVAHVAAQVFFLAGPATLLVNANPLLRLDGYYVLSDLVDIPNLREQGRRLLGGFLESKLFGIAAPASHLSGWRRTFAGVHAAASVVFQFVWMGGLVIVVSMWAGPLGLAVAASAMLLWAIVPATRWCYRVWMYQGTGDNFSRGSHRRRIGWTLLTFLTIGQFFLTLPSPFVVEVPVVARFSGEQILRAPVSGFVQHVYWNSGDTVHEGEVILRIENHELEVQRDEIALQLESELIEWQRNEQQQALGLAEASVQRSDSLRRKLSELQEQVDSLQVKANRDGEILTPQLHRLQDEFVSVGDELARIGQQSHKELLLSIGEDEMNAYQEAFVKQQPLRVCFRGGQWIDVVPTAIRPRGSLRVPHPALAASAGGPIPVAPADDERNGGAGVEWLSPRFEAVIELPPSKADAVRCGEVGHLALQDKRSMARRFWVWLGGS